MSNLIFGTHFIYIFISQIVFSKKFNRVFPVLIRNYILLKFR